MSLPPKWMVAKLRDLVTELETGKRPRGGVAGIASGIPSIGGEHLDRSGGFRLGNLRFVPESFSRAQRRGWIAEGDILVVKDGATTGRTSHVGKGFPFKRALLNEHVFRVKVSTRVSAKYAFYWMFSSPGHEQIRADFRGAAQGGISQGFVDFVELPLAPGAEQQRIVEAIESYLTRLDEAVATLDRVQRNLKRYRASVLKAAVEGRLVPTEAELARAEGREYEPASVLLERILAERRQRWDEAELAKMKAKGKVPKDNKWKAKYVEPVAPETSGLPELPEGWCWSSIGQLFEVRVGATPSRARDDYWGGGIPWVSSSEVGFCRIASTRETISEEGLRNSSTQLNPAGSVLLGMIGEGRTRGQAAILDTAACNSQNSAALWVSEAGLPPEYVYFYLVEQYEVTRTRGSGNNQPALNKSRVQAIPMPLPPLAEMLRIIAAAEGYLSVADRALGEAGGSRLRCVRLRQSILKWAFEGRLVDQDPADEPASVLLERIRAERDALAAKPQRRPRQTRKAAPKK